MADGGMVQTAAAAVGVAPGGGAAYMTPATPVVPLRPPMSRLGHRRSSGTDEFASFPDPGQVELVVSKTSSELFSRSLAESWWSPATEALQKQVGLCAMIHYSLCRPFDSIGRHIDSDCMFKSMCTNDTWYIVKFIECSNRGRLQKPPWLCGVCFLSVPVIVTAVIVVLLLARLVYSSFLAGVSHFKREKLVEGVYRRWRQEQ